MYPNDDEKFEETTIQGTREENTGWVITFADGWSFFVPKDHGVTPKENMTARLYGNGLGSPVRGLFLDGIKVFYRSETEQKEHSEISLYGKNAEDWLDRWDSGNGVWSIEMGGLGPGYEQAIQVTVAELVRIMIDGKFDHSQWEDAEKWKADREKITKAAFANSVIDKLGLSGAQFGAANGLAARIYSRGPRAIMTDDAVKDRHIQVSKNFPAAA